MTKSKLLLTAIISLSVSFAGIANAENKVNKGVNMSGALGKNLDVENPNKKVEKKSGNIFYNATVGKKQAEAAPKVVQPVAVVIPGGGGSGIINKDVVRKNQSKEHFISNGMKYLGEEDLSNALSEFRKAQSVSNDSVIQRWIHVVNTKIKIKQVNKKIEEMGEKK